MINLGLVRVGLHHPRFEGKGIVSNQVIGHVPVIMGKWFRGWESSYIPLKGSMEGGSKPCATIASTTFSSYVNVDELVVGIADRHQNDAVKPLVIEVQ